SKRSVNHIVFVVCTNALGQNIVHTSGFKYCAHRTTSDNTGTRSCRLEQNASSAFMSKYVMRNGATDHGNLKQILASSLVALTNRFGDLIRLTKANSYAAFFIAHNHKS